MVPISRVYTPTPPTLDMTLLGLVAHDCGTPCRATRVALHVSQLISWIL